MYLYHLLKKQKQMFQQSAVDWASFHREITYDYTTRKNWLVFKPKNV
jgi:hypothetical protein